MSLVVGVGLSNDAEAQALSDLTGALLRQHGLDPRDFPSRLLAAQDAPHPSAVVRSAVGTASVAEAAVLAAGATLVVPKTVLGRCTVAVGLSGSPGSRPPGTPEGPR